MIVSDGFPYVAKPCAGQGSVSKRWQQKQIADLLYNLDIRNVQALNQTVSSENCSELFKIFYIFIDLLGLNVIYYPGHLNGVLGP